ncbi:MAG TPA: TerB family tellurite resistance protein [Candidatus Hydrogenedentes bacterium]|nr:TerB family tellurite resistance protein [Candidatus Hydrogenedentota bacterium]
MAILSRVKDLFAAPESTSPQIDSERVRIAACVLLLEVAAADDEFSNAERSRIIAVLRARFDLSQTEAQELIEAAHDHRRLHYDLWHFTRTINEACTPSEKQSIIEEIWRVVYADGELEAHEDYMAHKLARLLNLNHPQLIQAKIRAKTLEEGEGP